VTDAAAAPKAWWTRVVQALVLASLFGLLYGTTRVVPGLESSAGIITAVGFLLLTGTLASELIEVIGLPHLSGYLLAGIVAGPHVLHLIDHRAVEELSGANALALALIAMEGGAQLRIDALRKGLRSLGWATLAQTTIVMVVSGVVFAAARPLIPFLAPLPLRALAGIALIWGALAVSRSPSATLGILAQTRASGPVARSTVTFVMSSNLVVAVLVAAALVAARPLIDPTASLAVRDVQRLGYRLLASVAIGTTLGLTLAVYIRLVGRQLILVFVALGFGLTAMLRYLRFDPLLTFMVAGFVVQNLSKQGERLVESITRTGSVVYVVFFATAGAHVDLPLLRELWPVALLLCAARGGSTWVAGRVGSRAAEDPPEIRKWGWAGLVAQAGLTLGVMTIVERDYPSFGAGFRALALSTVALNEMVGPILFKLALDRSGETSKGPRPSLQSLSERAIADKP